MQRNLNQPGRVSPLNPHEVTPLKPISLSRMTEGQVGTVWDMLAIRLVFIAVCVTAGYHFRPFSMSRQAGLLTGFGFAVAVILFEIRLRRASLRRLIGAATGSILGILGAYLTSLIFTHTTMPESTRSFFSLAVFLVMTYIGLVLG